MIIVDWYRRRPLFWWAIFFCIGILIQQSNFMQLTPLLIFIIAVLLLGCVLFSLQLNAIVLIMSILTFVSVYGMFRMQSTTVTPNSLLDRLAAEEIRVMYTGKVLSIDSTRNGFIYCMTDPESVYQRTISARPVQVWLPVYPEQLKAGDRIVGAGIFSRYSQARNPGEFDYRDYQALKQLYFQFSIEYPWQFRVKPGVSETGRQWISQIRNRVHHIFQQALSSESAAFADALILGDRDMVDENTIETYSDLGVIHVMAVSGLHVGFVVLILLVLTQLLPVPHRFRVLLVIAGLVFYTWLVDFRPSVIRASTMAALFLIALAYEEQTDGLNILGLAALLILFLDPLQLFMLGFQLSFIAVLGIILVYGRIEEIFESHGMKIQQLHPVVRWLAGIILVSLAAFLATIPVTAYHFRTVPIYGILVNVVVIPMIGFIVMNLFLVLLTGIVMQPAGHFLAALPDVCIRWLNILLEYFRSAGLGAIQIPHFDIRLIIIAYAALAIFVLWKFTLIRRIALYGILIGLNLWILLSGNQNEKLRVTFFDVGQADAALIEAPGDVNILVDAGNLSLYSDSGTKILLPYFRYQGIHHLNIVVISHPHADHIGGLPAVLNEIPVEEIWTIQQNYESKLYEQILEIAATRNVKTRQVAAGFDTVLADLQVLTLFPTSSFHDENINNHSIVQKFIYKENSILFPGDMEIEIDAKLYPFEPYLKADIFKVPHHGSITSSSREILQFISPEYAVVSVGKGNKFRHPSAEVMQRYHELDIQTRLTQNQGAVVFESDGESWQHINWR